MAQIKISELPIADESSGVFPIVQNGETKQLSLSNVVTKRVAPGQIQLNDYWVNGSITSGSSQIRLFIPFAGATAGTYSCEFMQIAPRFANGGYGAAKSGTSGQTVTSLAGENSAGAIVWENGATKRTNEVSHIIVTAREGSGFDINLRFRYALQRTTSDTTAPLNNSPVGAQINITIVRQ